MKLCAKGWSELIPRAGEVLAGDFIASDVTVDRPINMKPLKSRLDVIVTKRRQKKS